MTLAPLLLAFAAAQAGPTVLSLEEALRQAEERNLDLAAARLRLTQAREISRKAWSGYLPQVSASGGYTYSNNEAKIGLPTAYYIRDMGQPQGPVFDPTKTPSTENPPGAQTPYVMVPAGFMEAVIQKQHQFSGALQVSQGLILPGLYAQIENAYLAEKVAELSVENARREVLFAVVQLYYGAEALRESVEVQDRLMEVNRQHEKDAELGVQVGTAPQMALVRAQIERTRAEQDLLRTKNAYRSAVVALATLLDREPDFQVTRPPAPSPAGEAATLESVAQEKRPDIVLARESAKLAEGTRRAVWARYAPNLAAFARYSAANAKGFTGEYGSWNAGLQLSWTLWDGGMRESELRESAAKIAESEVALRAAKNRARDEVRRAALDLDSAEANRVKAAEQVKLATRNAELVKVSFEAGSSTSLEVVDANAALRGAELSLISETLNSQLASLRLAKAAGLFDPNAAGGATGQQASAAAP